MLLLQEHRIVSAVHVLHGLVRGDIDCFDLLSRISFYVSQCSIRHTISFYTDIRGTNTIVKSLVYIMCNNWNKQCRLWYLHYYWVVLIILSFLSAVFFFLYIHIYIIYILYILMFFMCFGNFVLCKYHLNNKWFTTVQFEVLYNFRYSIYRSLKFCNSYE